jgi:hypothetical protein
MGTLIAMAYSTPLFADQADHTYVMCGAGGKAWGCWGGTSSPAEREIRRGEGSTLRADAIAEPNERAGIKCYLINGVCHQAANRILLPAGITVRGARGYSISEALFGPYGRIGLWPCRAPFNRHEDVTGDLPECLGPSRPAMSRRMAEDDSESRYLRGVLAMYREAQPLMTAETIPQADAERFGLRLFMHMAEFRLGPRLDADLSSGLAQVHHKIERMRSEAEEAFAAGRMAPREFVSIFNMATMTFQEEMAGLMSPEQYRALFDLERDERVVLADREIVERVFEIRQ